MSASTKLAAFKRNTSSKFFLPGLNLKDLPVEGIDKIDLVINLKNAKEIGLTIPPNVLVRADRVIR